MSKIEKCAHISERIPGELADIIDKEGKEHFLSDKLRCSKCLVIWRDLVKETQKELDDTREGWGKIPPSRKKDLGIL